jgi:hypothetical protein
VPSPAQYAPSMQQISPDPIAPTDAHCDGVPYSGDNTTHHFVPRYVGNGQATAMTCRTCGRGYMAIREELIEALVEARKARRAT